MHSDTFKKSPQQVEKYLFCQNDDKMEKTKWTLFDQYTYTNISRFIILMKLRLIAAVHFNSGNNSQTNQPSCKKNM